MTNYIFLVCFEVNILYSSAKQTAVHGPKKEIPILGLTHELKINKEWLQFFQKKKKFNIQSTLGNSNLDISNN